MKVSLAIFRKLDILINNAGEKKNYRKYYYYFLTFFLQILNHLGIVSGSALLDTPDEKIVRTFDVNVLAHFWTLKAFLPDMISQKNGHIVNVASLAGHAGQKKLVDYCSSKFAAVASMLRRGTHILYLRFHGGVYGLRLPHPTMECHLHEKMSS